MSSDYLLEIDGIKGESADKKKPATIEIESFSWGVTQTGSHSGGSGGGAGKASFQDVHFTTKVNKSSPLLFQASAEGKHIKKAVLFVRKAGGEQQDYYQITMSDLLISSYQSGGSSSGTNAIPTDQFSVNFTKIEFSYQPQKADGTLDTAVKASWNLKENTK